MHTTVRFKGILNNRDRRDRVVKNFLSFIIIYIHYFCTPFLSSLVNVRNRYRKRCELKRYELLNFNCKKNDNFIEYKKSLFKLSLLQKGKAKNNLLLQPLSYTTVLYYKLRYRIRFFCCRFFTLSENLTYLNLY